MQHCSSLSCDNTIVLLTIVRARSSSVRQLLNDRFRRLAVEDPREARKAFPLLCDSGGSLLEQFLGQISSPSDGRLRHLVASALRNNRDKERYSDSPSMPGKWGS
jgi:hypothetical protein